jgi:hypothetical protein
MRILELLSEANLQRSDFYDKSRLDQFIQKLEKRDPFQVNDTEKVIDASKEEIEALKLFRDTAYTSNTTIRKEITRGLPLTVGGVRLSSIFKTDEFGGKSSAKSANIGPAVELLKSVAIYAQLTNRGDNPVSIEDIKELVYEVKNNAVLKTRSEKSKTKIYISTIEKEVDDKSGNVKDHIELKIMLGRGPFLRATELNPTDDALLTKLSGILKYVNTESDLRKYSKFFANNNKRDPIKIQCIGGHGLKTDIRTTYLNSKDGNEKSKVLKHLSMSIKAENSRIDQSPGTDSSGIQKFFKTLGLDTHDAIQAMDLAAYQSKIKRQSSTKEEHDNRVRACTEILKLAGKKLNEKFSQMDDQGESKFIHHFLGSLTTAMTGNEDLVYVNFDNKGSYYKLNPTLIRNLSKHVDLETKVHISSDGVSYLYIVDKKSSRSLFHVRLMITRRERIAYFFDLDNLLDMVKETTSTMNNTVSSISNPSNQPPEVLPKDKEPQDTTPVDNLKNPDPDQQDQDEIDNLKKNAGL